MPAAPRLINRSRVALAPSLYRGAECERDGRQAAGRRHGLLDRGAFDRAVTLSARLAAARLPITITWAIRKGVATPRHAAPRRAIEADPAV